MVSHDRAFINNVTNRTIEISCGHIYDYKVAYDEFVVLRKERREQQLRAYGEPARSKFRIREDFIERSVIRLPRLSRCRAASSNWKKIVPIEKLMMKIIQPYG